MRWGESFGWGLRRGRRFDELLYVDGLGCFFSPSKCDISSSKIHACYPPTVPLPPPTQPYPPDQPTNHPPTHQPNPYKANPPPPPPSSLPTRHPHTHPSLLLIIAQHTIHTHPSLPLSQHTIPHTPLSSSTHPCLPLSQHTTPLSSSSSTSSPHPHPRRRCYLIFWIIFGLWIFWRRSGRAGAVEDGGMGG